MADLGSHGNADRDIEQALDPVAASLAGGKLVWRLPHVTSYLRLKKSLVGSLALEEWLRVFYTRSAKDGLDANDGVKASNESERKLLIKQLIEQETFTRVESYELALLIDSKVTDKPIELEERPATFPRKIRQTTDEEDRAMYYKTLFEVKKWYLEKKRGTRSVANEETSGTEHVLQLYLCLKDSEVGQINVGSFTVKIPCPTSSSSKPDQELHSELGCCHCHKQLFIGSQRSK